MRIRLVNTVFSLMLLLLLGLPLAAQEEEAPAMYWWNDVVWYQVFVRSFYDSDGDGIGDLRGLIAKLDYLNDGDPNTSDDLGITGIKLMPIMDAVSYHGYDVIDYRRVHPDFGTNDDFLHLIQEANKRGIRVIIDLVVNHTSTQNEWFVRAAAGDPAYKDYFKFSVIHPATIGPWGQNVWHFNEASGQFYYGVFCCNMPDLNYDNPTVASEMYDIAGFWLDEMGVDGFRLDAIKYVIEDGDLLQNSPANRQWLARFRDYIKQIYPDAIVVGEVFDTTIAVERYVQDGSVDIAFEFDLADRFLSAVRGANNNNLTRMLERGLRGYPFGQYATFLSNHDLPRVMTQLNGNVEQAKAAASLQLTLPGSPFIYYGEEIGMFGSKPDERIRTPMQWDATPITAGFTTAVEPWQPLNDAADTYNVASLSDDPDSILNHYRQLIRLRNEHEALRRGTLQIVSSQPRQIMAYLRQTEGETVLVLVNLSNRQIEDYALTLESGGLATSVSSAELLFGHSETVTVPQVSEAGGFAEYQPLPSIAPYATYVLKLN